MNYFFYKIDNIKYKGFDIYYKKLIDNEMHKATEYNDKYIYYYKESKNIKELELGKFKIINKMNSRLLYHDYDYDVYEFESGQVFSDKLNFVYSIAISDSDENMILIEDITFTENITMDNLEIYYKIV